MDVKKTLQKANSLLEAIGDTHDFKDIKSKIKTLTKRGFKVDITDKHGWQFAQAEKVNPSPTDITAVNVFVKSLKAKPVKAARVEAGVTRYEVPYTTENGLDTAFLVDVVRNSDGNRPDRKLPDDAIGVYLMK